METNQPTPLARTLRTAFAAFIVLTCIRVWTGPVALDAAAQAQIPDSGMQRKLQLDEAKHTNQLLSEIKQLLTTGTLNVRIQSADNSTGAPASTARPDK